MKKGFFRFLACGVMLALLLAFSACSKNEVPSVSSNTSTSSVGENSESDSMQDPNNEQASATGKYKTIAAFLESDAMQKQLESIKSSLENQEINISVTAEENKLIYAYTYTSDVDTTAAAGLLEEGIKNQASTFQNVASMLKLAVDVENPIVVVTYLDKNGEEIYTAEFTKDGLAGSNQNTSGVKTEKYKTIAEFVESAEMQQQLESAKSAVEAQGMSISVAGEEDKLIYTYTFAEGTDLTDAEEVLKEGLDAQAGTFESVASTLKLVVDVENPIVVVTYLNSDGTVVYSDEFTAK